MVSDSFDPDADVSLTFEPGEAVEIMEVLASAAGYREAHHCDFDDALAAFLEEWIDDSGWQIVEDYGPWSGFIEMVEDLRWRHEHQPDTWRGDREEPP